MQPHPQSSMVAIHFLDINLAPVLNEKKKDEFLMDFLLLYYSQPHNQV